MKLSTKVCLLSFLIVITNVSVVAVSEIKKEQKKKKTIFKRAEAFGKGTLLAGISAFSVFLAVKSLIKSYHCIYSCPEDIDGKSPLRPEENAEFVKELRALRRKRALGYLGFSSFLAFLHYKLDLIKKTYAYLTYAVT